MLSVLLHVSCSLMLTSSFCRYSGLCTHSDEIFCTAIHEFGKRGDMASALTVFEASKHNLGRVNMYAYRTIIDVCGLCCDHLQSRSIYEVC